MKISFRSLRKKEIDFSAKLEGKGRFRVNFFNQINGLAGVFRTIPDTIKSCDELGIPPFMTDLAMLDRDWFFSLVLRVLEKVLL